MVERGYETLEVVLVVVRPDRDAKDPPVLPLVHRHLVAIVAIATLPSFGLVAVDPRRGAR